MHCALFATALAAFARLLLLFPFTSEGRGLPCHPTHPCQCKGWVRVKRRTRPAELAGRGLDWQDAVMVQLHLADLSHFAAANQAYASVLPRVRMPGSAACKPHQGSVAFRRVVGGWRGTQVSTGYASTEHSTD